MTGDASLRREGRREERREERKGEAKDELARDQERADEKAEEVADLEQDLRLEPGGGANSSSIRIRASSLLSAASSETA